MRPQNSSNQQAFIFNLQLSSIHQAQISMTPQKNKSEKLQALTASIMDLTPLMSPARLGRSFLPILPNNKMEYIQTPCRPLYSLMIPLFDQNYQDNRQPQYPSSMFIFDKEEVDQAAYCLSGSEQSNSQNENHQDNDNGHQDSKEFQSQNIGTRNQLVIFEPKRLSPECSQDSKQKDDYSKKCICNCKKTQCLKLYCDCFREGESCGPNCQCNSCHNTIEFQEERSQVRHQLMKRNPEAFKAKIEDLQHSKGCNCKKTYCLKKYCECFQAGLDCGSHCKCQDCKNGQQNSKYNKYDMEEKFKNTVKKQRRMKEL